MVCYLCSEQLKVRQYDPEETVRMEVVNCMLQVARRDFTICTDEMLSFIKDRTLDKKVCTQSTAASYATCSEYVPQ